MQRIAVIGSPGAGKSTLARELGQLLGIGVSHLDRLYWRPGWTPRPRPEWVALQEELVARERWIIDGNYGGTMEIRLAAADTVIYLDFPRWHCLWGAVKRAWQHRSKPRPDMAAGCPERVDREFLRFIWNFPHEGRPALEAKLARVAAGKQVIRLRSRREAAAFLAAVGAGQYAEER